MMPETDGPVVYAAIRQRWPALVGRIVFVTGGAFTERNRDFLATVGAPVITKPLRANQLAAAYAKLRAE
jgi:CheY-like chemotaxis protein